MATYHAIFLKEIPQGTYWIEDIVDKLENQIDDIEHFGEFFDSDNTDGEICIRFSFSFDIEMNFTPQSCIFSEKENYEEACKIEKDKIASEIITELEKVEGFDRLEFIDD